MYTSVMGVFRSSFNPTSFVWRIQVEKLSVNRESEKEDLSEVSSTLNKDLKFIHSGTFIAIILHNSIAIYAMLFCRTAEIQQWVFGKTTIIKAE